MLKRWPLISSVIKGLSRSSRVAGFIQPYEHVIVVLWSFIAEQSRIAILSSAILQLARLHFIAHVSPTGQRSGGETASWLQTETSMHIELH
jgi:hypothetical protein